MLKITLISLIICLCLIGQGQVLNFNSMNAKNTNWYVRSSCADSSGNIYIGGDFSKIDTTFYWGIAKWNGTQWDSLGSGFHVPGQVLTYSQGARTLAFYKSHIYAGGVFTTVQGKPIRYIARWDGTNWDSLPQTPNLYVDRLIVLQGKLYVIGSFNKIGTISCNRMAVWDGASWTPVFVPFNIYTLADITVYNGELYVGGNIFNGALPGGLIKFDGTTWSVVGQGIKGGSAWVNALKVFNNELYIGGWIEKGAGNAGDFLIKWDGTNYHEVIGGLDGQVFNLTEVPDGLIATGCFTTPFISTLKISANGACGYNDTFNNCVNGSVYANNKLYFFGAFTTVNGDSSMGYINNVNYTPQTDSCISFVNGIKEINTVSNIKIYPNPTTSIINIVDESNQFQNATLNITDYLGQVVFSSPFNSQINLHSLSAGMYFLTVKDELNNKTIKIIKQ